MTSRAVGQEVNVPEFGRGRILRAETRQGRLFYWIYLFSFGREHLFGEHELNWYRMRYRYGKGRHANNI